jgi:hypothetical protein
MVAQGGLISTRVGGTGVCLAKCSSTTIHPPFGTTGSGALAVDEQSWRSAGRQLLYATMYVTSSGTSRLQSRRFVYGASRRRNCSRVLGTRRCPYELGAGEARTARAKPLQGGTSNRMRCVSSGMEQRPSLNDSRIPQSTFSPRIGKPGEQLQEPSITPLEAEQRLVRSGDWLLFAASLCTLCFGVCLGPRRVHAQRHERTIAAALVHGLATTDARVVSQDTSRVFKSSTERRPMATVSVPKAETTNQLDIGKLGYSLYDFVDKKKLFSSDLSARTETQLELEEIEDEEVQKALVLTVGRLLQTVGALVAAYFVYVGSRRWEEWMREEERLATEKEISLTGTYIDPAVPREDLERRRNPESSTPSGVSDDDSGHDPDTGTGSTKRPGPGPKPPSTDRGGAPDEGLDLLDDLLE